MENDVILLTGASRGIGREIAIEVAKSNCDLVLVGRNTVSLEETAHLCEKYNNKNYVISANLINRSEVERAIEVILKNDIQICSFINNHGLHNRGNVLSYGKGDYSMEEMIEVNLRSAITLTKLILPLLMKTKPNNPLYRAIIYIASLVARNPVKSSAAYTASKWGILGFAHALFDEIKEYNIKVSTICPGFVDTNQVNRDKLLKLDNKKMIQANDIVKTVKFILEFPNSGCPVEIQIRPQHNVFL